MIVGSKTRVFFSFNNTFVGHSSGTGTTGNNNVAVGSHALEAVGAAVNSVAVGHNAGNKYTGNGALILGPQVASTTLTTGTNVILIGTNNACDTPASGTSNYMAIASGALREGVLCDMLGRFHKEDVREISVQEFMQRYRIDPVQAARIESLAVMLGKQLLAGSPDQEKVEDALKMLSWAARLHEIGISVAHTGYHKHSAYILENADIPGFSRMEQFQLSQLVLSHHGSLAKTRDFLSQPVNLVRSVALRIAAIFYRSRTHVNLPDMVLSLNGKHCLLHIPQAWLERNPLTDTLLNNEIGVWAKVDIDLRIEHLTESHRTRSGAA